ncbi:PP2C-domain-containing protein [Auriscalpium vulgare]|uniref:PP2C-domain-containing protein n=1 Tax=Auriscalpium vulgare TaxID=40419 RepID=A0ACB8RUC7_9AGAM|nr:PP2C-domain-containing protein [Auriscalpium vulgare]
MALGRPQVLLGTSQFTSPESLAFPSSPTNGPDTPWAHSEDEPPTPPPKLPRTFGFSTKQSVASFSPPRSSQASSRVPRTSESTSFEDHGSLGSSSHGDSRSMLRKPKSSMNLFNMIKRSRSKPRLDEPDAPGSSKSMPPLPTYINHDNSFLSMGPAPSKGSLKKDRGRVKGKSTKAHPASSSSSGQADYNIDLNLNEMDGIIDRSRLPTVKLTDSPPATGADDGSKMFSAPSSSPPLHTSSPLFSDPFTPAPVAARRPQLSQDTRKVSPKTITPVVVPQQLVPTLSNANANEEQKNDWMPPESWNVDKEDEPLREPEYSSSEEDNNPLKALTDASPPAAGPSSSKRRTRRRTTTRNMPYSSLDTRPYKIRVHRANNSYHVLSLGLAVTVADLTPVLNSQLLMEGEREVHRLYLKERGRERMLAQTERPADIVRRRLEQAGYDVADGLEKLGGEDLSFVMKFVYKSNVLGPAEEDLIFTNYEHVDLTNKSLRTVPIALYGHAEDIASLNLSRNPMLEIPLDFVQTCTSLRELRLSNMSIKKVPQSVRQCTTLYNLDLSSNRIGDLNDAGLDRIPDLTNLMAQNNRMEQLPWYFPRLRSLRVLNISNNKFQEFPDVVCKMTKLVELDISFNMISALPEEIGQLEMLERLIMVGNRVSAFPDGCRRLINLCELDCRRNNITEMGVITMLPKLEQVLVNNNALHALDLSAGPYIQKIDVSHNDITQISLIPGPVGHIPQTLTTLNISHAKLSSLDDITLSHLTYLENLVLDCNNFRFIPDSLGDLSRLVTFSCSDNSLELLPSSIGRLQRLERLDVHNNNLLEIPASLWNCASLMRINMTSNLISTLHPPATFPASVPTPSSGTLTVPDVSASASSASLLLSERKISTASSMTSIRVLPPLVHSLERLYLGENQLSDDALPYLTMLRELRVLNLSFNDIQEMPRSFFKEMTRLEELYMSGNKLASLPTEDLHRLTKLEIMFLNGNRLQTLPQELGKVPSLGVLDVGSNALKYNISNWEFDWNWNFNQNLRYLNLSGNKRLEIKADQTRKGGAPQHKAVLDLAGFGNLTQLKVLGLMDVTTTFAPNIPDDNEERRVRTSLSEVNHMQYGIADNLGNRDCVSMYDLVQPAFRDRKDEAIFAMFGRAQASANNSRISKHLHDHFVPIFADQLKQLDLGKGEGAPDAMRRAFLRLNRVTHDFLFSGGTPARKMSQASQRSAALLNNPDTSGIGASGIVAYIKGHTLFVGNAGNALAVVSRRGNAEVVSSKHDPFDRNEIARIRAAEGWVSPKGLVNDEVDVSRSFGFYHLLPVVNARPDVAAVTLTELDEFIIIGNNGLWDYVSYQTAVDIARSERADPMIAAQKLRDFAISYGAEGTTMIMVISFASLFSRAEGLDAEIYRPRRKKDDIIDRGITRLDEAVPAPIGHLTVAFTDIRNSTHLWETNAGMPTAIRMHHNLLRRQLRFCGGYEVKTEGDAFMVAFQTTTAALLWCLNVQVGLLAEPWPKEILDCPDGKEVLDAEGTVIARGLSVRMGIHCGQPVCEPDVTTRRMDYYGPMVNRSSRINGCASGGQIMVSADVAREIEARVLDMGADTEYSAYQLPHVLDAIRDMGIVQMPVGEVKLKGLEVPEMLYSVYPRKLVGRAEMEDDEGAAGSGGGSGSGVVELGAEADVEDEGEPYPEHRSRAHVALCGAEQVRELAELCVRVQALAGDRVFRPRVHRKGSTAQALPPPDARDVDDGAVYLYGDPHALLPSVSEKASEAELLAVLQYLLLQLENAVALLATKLAAPELDAIVRALEARRGRALDADALARIMDMLAS